MIIKFFFYRILEKALTVNEELSNSIARLEASEDTYLEYRRQGDYVTASVYGKNIIWNINLKTCENQFVKIPNNSINVTIATYYENCYWLISSNTANIYCWKIQCNEWEEYVAKDIQALPKTNKMFLYKGFIFGKKEILLFSHYASNIVKINREKKTLENVFDYPDGFRIISNRSIGATFEGATECEGEICFIPGRGSHIICYNSENKKVRGIEFAVEENTISYFDDLLEAHMKKEVAKEGEICTLMRYINDISVLHEKERECADIGKQICETLLI